MANEKGNNANLQATRRALPKVAGFKSVCENVNTPEVKALWTNRLLLLLSISLDDNNVKNAPIFKDMLEEFGLFKGITLGDAMHLMQIKKAMSGDTKAYTAVQKVVSSATDIEGAKNMQDHNAELTSILLRALNGANISTADEPIIIEADYADSDSEV